MNLPVANWRAPTVEGIPLFHDLQDAGLMHYGPKAQWGQLITQQLGNTATVLSGLIDLAPSPDEIKNLQTLTGARLAPLVATDSANSLRVSLEVGAAHELKIAVVPALPFPQVVFRASIKHSDAHHMAHTKTIQDRWQDHTLLVGGLRLRYSMRQALCAYEVRLKTSEVRPELAAAVGTSLVSGPHLYSVLRKLAAGSFGKWIQDLAPKTAGNGLRDEVTDAVAELIGSSFFREAGKVVSFDNGRQVKGYELHEPMTLHSEFQERLTKSDEVDEDMHYFT